MGDWWPVLFSVSQVAQVVCLIKLSGRVERSMALKKHKPFEHIVCKPGDVVCIALPERLSPKALERMRQVADDFEKETSAKLHIFADGVQFTGTNQ
ncbi:hypothetical protein [Comamonas kerstersii]|uniref:hypothetical protein n=1 Tax=Comamonas kerstersii TaxID=225992 RepID=UPI001B339B62|nr:hypothetical protein [Comamonas kerstersii]QTW20220.1 hypothetical protein H8N02_07335 [Comamonas kerstersii]